MLKLNSTSGFAELTINEAGGRLGVKRSTASRPKLLVLNNKWTVIVLTGRCVCGHRRSHRPLRTVCRLTTCQSLEYRTECYQPPTSPSCLHTTTSFSAPAYAEHAVWLVSTTTSTDSVYPHTISLALLWTFTYGE